MNKRCCRKECSLKGQLQPLENFGKASHTKDGHAFECNTCARERKKLYARQRHKNKTDFYKMYL